MTIQFKFRRYFRIAFRVDRDLLSVEKVADHAEELPRLTVVHLLDGRIVDVVKSKWFHSFPPFVFRGCFMAFRKSRRSIIGILLLRIQKSPQKGLRALRVRMFGIPSHIKATGTPVLCAHRKIS